MLTLRDSVRIELHHWTPSWCQRIAELLMKKRNPFGIRGKTRHCSAGIHMYRSARGRTLLSPQYFWCPAECPALRRSSVYLCSMNERPNTQRTKNVQGDPWAAQRSGACLWPRARSWRPESNPTLGSRCMEPASPSACVSASLSLSVTIINK